MAIKRPEDEVNRVGRVVECDFGDRKGVVAMVGGLNVSLDERLWIEAEPLRPRNFKRAEIDLYTRVTRGQNYHEAGTYTSLHLGRKRVQTNDLKGASTVGYEVFASQRGKG